MSITAAELILYGSLNNPTDDVTLTGGAPDAQRRPVFTQLGTTALVGTSVLVYSSNAADTRNITATGRDATGTVVSETVSLNGVTAVTGAQAFQRIQSVVVASSGSQIATVGGGGVGNLGQIPPGEIGFFMMFRNAFSTTSQSVRYEKTFWKNTDATLTLQSSNIQLAADPSGVLQVGIDTALNGSATVTNRLNNAPAGVSFVGAGVNQSLPGAGGLPAGGYIGVWVSQTLAINNAPIENYFNLQLAGNTT